MKGKNMADKTKKRRAGFYWLDDKPYVSVTNVLKIIDKPALRYWFGQQVYYAVAKDPTLNEREALSAPYRTSKSAASRGTAIHRVIETFKNDPEVINHVPEEYKGYVEAFVKWYKDIKPEFLETEKTVVSHEHKYAGTLDLKAKIGGEECLIDFKTSKDGKVYDEAHIQLSAYCKAEGTPRGFIIGLGENGNYNHVEADLDFEVFLASKKIWEFKNRKMIESIGY